MTHLRDRVAQIIFDHGDGSASSMTCNRTADAILAEIELSKARARIAELEAATAQTQEEYDHE